VSVRTPAGLALAGGRTHGSVLATLQDKLQRDWLATIELLHLVVEAELETVDESRHRTSGRNSRNLFR
jgi:hypothetical protein